MNMMTNRDIIVFSDDWGRHPSSCQHLISQLLPANRVVWVNTIGMRSPQITLHDIKRCSEILTGWFSSSPEEGNSHLPQNLTVISPIIIPYNRYSVVRSFNRFSVQRTVRQIMEVLGMVKPLVVTTFPCTSDYVGAFDEHLHIYYCVDDFANWPGVDLNLICSMEDELIERSDLVIATAEELCDEKTRNGKRPFLLAHGVDFEHFNAAPRFTERPVELQEINKPIIGFFGAISEWLDFDLIAALATNRPEWSFVFIGPVDTGTSALSGIKNICMLGKIPYLELPRYAACFDVGIIPFQVNELTKSVNPLKLFEYLASGIPVVSSYMPEVAKYRDVVAIARDQREFLEFLDVAVSADSSELRQQRIELARRHSWCAVAERFTTLVNATEQGKQKMASSTGGE